MVPVKKGFKIEALGKIAASGWGDKVLVGALRYWFDRFTPEKLYLYIRDDKAIYGWISEKQWQGFRRMASGAKVLEIDNEQLIEELRKYRPDLLGVIINHPNGQQWFDNQIAEVRKKLTS